MAQKSQPFSKLINYLVIGVADIRHHKAVFESPSPLFFCNCKKTPSFRLNFPYRGKCVCPEPVLVK